MCGFRKNGSKVDSRTKGRNHHKILFLPLKYYFEALA